MYAVTAFLSIARGKLYRLLVAAQLGRPRGDAKGAKILASGAVATTQTAEDPPARRDPRGPRSAEIARAPDDGRSRHRDRGSFELPLC
jgi:hypothetical protein